jgi:hypothetical protein
MAISLGEGCGSKDSGTKMPLTFAQVSSLESTLNPARVGLSRTGWIVGFLNLWKWGGIQAARVKSSGLRVTSGRMNLCAVLMLRV